MADVLSRLSSWLVEAGGHHEGVEAREIDGMRGLVATRAHAAGATLLQVPRALLVSARAAIDQLAARQLATAELAKASNVVQLAAWLAVERRDPESAFGPYLAALPQSFAEFPTYATTAELALLDGSLAGGMIENLRASVAAEYAQLVAEVPWFGAFDADAFTWARTCVGSRTYLLHLDGHDVGVLVPFADLANHQRGPNTRWEYDEADQAFRLVARRDYAPGEEVCCDYGPKPNMAFLAHYGFCLEDNPADQAEIGDAEPVRIGRDLADPFAQMMLLRTSARCDDEAAARAALAEAARAGLARFATTLAEDEALLAAGTLSPLARNLVRARLGEKRVLHAWLAFAADGPAAWFQ